MSHPFAGELFGAAETWRINTSPKHGRGCELAKYGATFSWREAADELWTASFPKSHWQETALPAVGEEGQTLKMMVPVRLSVLQLSNWLKPSCSASWARAFHDKNLERAF